MSTPDLLWWQRDENLEAAMLEGLACGLEVDRVLSEVQRTFRNLPGPAWRTKRDDVGRTWRQVMVDRLREATAQTRAETTIGSDCRPDLHVWRRNCTNFDGFITLQDFRPCVCLQRQFGDLPTGTAYVDEQRGRDGAVITNGIRFKAEAKRS